MKSDREFKEWLDERRTCDVSAVFHELVAMFAAVRSEQHAECVRLLREECPFESAESATNWLEQQKP